MKQKIILPKNLPFLELELIFNSLSAYGESRLVGGCVRDILLGKEPKDYDIATSVKPELALTILNNANIKTLPTGIKHGTITAFINNMNFEITTLRTENACDGRHASVEYTSNWEQDAIRRDFTINAMYLDLKGNLYDYFEGYSDLEKRIVKFVGDPIQRIKEDYLRILRFFRFYSYLGGSNIDNLSFQAVIDNAMLIGNLSGERISAEIYKILSAPFSYESLNLISQHNILRSIGFADKKVDFKQFKLSQDPRLNFAFLIKIFKFSVADFQKLSARLKFSNNDIAFFEKICFRMPSLKHGLKEQLYYYGKELTMDYLSLENILNPYQAFEKHFAQAIKYSVKKLPINGKDVMDLGFTGKTISIVIKYLEEKWIISNFELNREELLSELSKFKT